MTELLYRFDGKSPAGLVAAQMNIRSTFPLWSYSICALPYLFIFFCISVFVCLPIHVCVETCACLYMYVWRHVSAYTCTCGSMYILKHVCVKAFICLYMYVQKHAYAYIYHVEARANSVIVSQGTVHLEFCCGSSICHSSGTCQLSWTGWAVSPRPGCVYPRAGITSMIYHIW